VREGERARRADAVQREALQHRGDGVAQVVVAQRRAGQKDVVKGGALRAERGDQRDVPVAVPHREGERELVKAELREGHAGHAQEHQRRGRAERERALVPRDEQGRDPEPARDPDRVAQRDEAGEEQHPEGVERQRRGRVEVARERAAGRAHRGARGRGQQEQQDREGRSDKDGRDQRDVSARRCRRFPRARSRPGGAGICGVGAAQRGGVTHRHALAPRGQHRAGHTAGGALALKGAHASTR
jgi:hypothetical protein